MREISRMHTTENAFFHLNTFSEQRGSEKYSSIIRPESRHQEAQQRSLHTEAFTARSRFLVSSSLLALRWMLHSRAASPMHRRGEAEAARGYVAIGAGKASFFWALLCCCCRRRHVPRASRYARAPATDSAVFLWHVRQIWAAASYQAGAMVKEGRIAQALKPLRFSVFPEEEVSICTLSSFF